MMISFNLNTAWAWMSDAINTTEIFTLSTRPVAVSEEAKVSVCWMDKGPLLESALNEHYRILKNTDFSEFVNDYASFFQCQIKAESYQLNYLPAVVFNEKEVVYGVDSLREARTIREKRGA